MPPGPNQVKSLNGGLGRPGFIRTGPQDQPYNPCPPGQKIKKFTVPNETRYYPFPFLDDVFYKCVTVV